MNPLLKPRTLNQILTSRKQKQPNKCHQTVSHPSEQQGQYKYESLLRKSSFNNEDKIVLLRHIEKKWRVRFDHLFAVSLLTWICAKDKTIIDKHYDSSKRSYFVLKGFVSICEKGGLRDTANSDRFEQVLKVESGGFGCVFNPEQSHRHCILISQSSVVLRFDHPEHELTYIERNCLMTTEQKEIAIKKCPLFKEIGNVNKFYTPYFETRLYSKGETIYNVGDPAQHLFLVIEGQVEFESKILEDNPELEGADHQISQLCLKNVHPRYRVVNTDIISSSNFFGEQEILTETRRLQTSKCFSLTCLLMLIPLEKFHKLMFYNEFKNCIQSTVKGRQCEREKMIHASTAVQFYRQETNKILKTKPSQTKDTFQFEEFNKKVYFSRTEKTQPTSKLSLKDSRTKLVHGNPIKLSSNGRIKKSERFSMLEVNKTQYESSLKKFRGYSLKQNPRKTNENWRKKTIGVDGKDDSDSCVRNLRQIWQALKLEQVLIDDSERLPLESEQGKVYYQCYMRRQKHLSQVKSYRPKNINSTNRAKTQYLQYLEQII